MDSLLPFLWGFFIPYNIPVYPGALRIADNTRGVCRARTAPLLVAPCIQSLGQ